MSHLLRLAFLHVCLILVLASVVPCHSAVDTVIHSRVIHRIIDLDDDDVRDTVVALRHSIVRDSVALRHYLVPERILWGDDTPRSSDDRDTTEFNLPIKRSAKSTIRYFDYDSDGTIDIHITWNHTDSSGKHNRFRELVFLGGQNLRSAGTLAMGSVRGQKPNNEAAVSLDTDDDKRQFLGTGRYYFRQRPKAASFAKAPAPKTESISDELQAGFSLHPNPASGVVTVVFRDTELAPVQLALYGNDGRLVLSRGLDSESSLDQIEVDVQTLATGAYSLVVVYDDGSRSSQSLVIQR